MAFDPQAVRDFGHAGWQRAAAHYTTTFARATRGFTHDLLDAARVGAGMRVLDLACGPGLVASGAAERGAPPVGLDFSSAMIALARSRLPHSRRSKPRSCARAPPTAIRDGFAVPLIAILASGVRG
jgi:cyclopropane fatty-acyl-phospholipid synthase-like methyltransferase